MSFWAVVWVVLMILWLAGGWYVNRDPAKPYLIGNTFLPWLCVAILGAIAFGAVSGVNMGR